MKYILVGLVVVIGLWLLLRGRAGADDTPPATGRRKRAPGQAPASMVACAHCDLRLPDAEALSGPDGRRYCSEAHRLAGPR